MAVLELCGTAHDTAYKPGYYVKQITKLPFDLRMSFSEVRTRTLTFLTSLQQVCHCPDSPTYTNVTCLINRVIVYNNYNKIIFNSFYRLMRLNVICGMSKKSIDHNLM